MLFRSQLSEQSHVATFTAHDYLAMLARRFVTSTLTFTQIDQDSIAAALINAAVFARSTGTPGTSLSPGSWIPLVVLPVSADGTGRANNSSGQLRDRTYLGSSQIGTAFDDLAHVINGFDYDVVPGWRYTASNTSDWLRVFYPSQGIVRTEPMEYGGAISTVTRSVNSSDYANFVRVLGNNPDTSATAPQFFSEQWNADANNVTVTPIGLWMDAENAADVSIQSTLDQQALGTLNLKGVLLPSYTLGLTPGTYTDGSLNMGDTVPMIIKSGRLNVNGTLRIVGLSFAIGDDGQEDVGVTVGRPLTTLANMLTAAAQDINALARR